MSRSGSARGCHDRGAHHTSRPLTPPHRPCPRGVNPWRSPHLKRMETVGDLRRLPIATKSSSCQTTHSRSASEDERGGHPSRSSRSSSDQGRPERRELVDFTVEDFTAVSHTTNSILFTSGHYYIRGWVLILASCDQDRVRHVPCPHETDKEEEIRKRRRREVEPCHVQKFLRQELLRKAGQVGWEAPRVYQFDLADGPGWEAQPAVLPVVFVPSDSEDVHAKERSDR